MAHYKLMTLAQIRAFLRRPTTNCAAVGREAGMARSYVHQIKHGLIVDPPYSVVRNLSRVIQEVKHDQLSKSKASASRRPRTRSTSDGRGKRKSVASASASSGK